MEQHELGAGPSLRAVIASDVDRCRVLAEGEGSRGVVALARALLFYPSLYGVIAFRVLHATQARARRSPLHAAGYLFVLVAYRLVVLVTKVEISAHARIGPGLFINHAQGVVLGAFSAGSNLTVSHGVTIGRATNSDAADSFPRFGDRVWIGVGAVVVGGITVGDDAMIGSNAVVLRDVPARSFAAGVPAKVVSGDGSFANVRYRGMTQDPMRQHSLDLAQRPVG